MLIVEMIDYMQLGPCWLFLSKAHTMNNDDNDAIPTVPHNDDHGVLQTIISIDTCRSGVNGFGKYLS